MRKVLAVGLAMLLLGGCETVRKVELEEGVGAALGMVAGGLIGAQFGGGWGNVASTAGGVVVGGAAGLLAGDWLADRNPDKADSGIFK